MQGPNRRPEIRRAGTGVREARATSTPRERKPRLQWLRFSRNVFSRPSDFALSRVYPSRSAVPASGWGVPVERPFLPKIEIAHQQDTDVEEHFHEAKPPQLSENKGPRI